MPESTSQRQIAHALMTARGIDAGVTAATMSRMERDGEVLRLARGLYQLADAPLDASHSLAEAAKRVPKGVVCLVSAPRIPRPGRSASRAGMAGDRSEGLEPQSRRYADPYRAFHRQSAQRQRRNPCRRRRARKGLAPSKPSRTASDIATRSAFRWQSRVSRKRSASARQCPAKLPGRPSVAVSPRLSGRISRR